ncbi:hypothetical protein [Proteiniphilum saccharofermentans]|uniref:hypothetical protein n=1 Tax=Proteiniphilum saccharofermentans TaxID=1642647 RepID=UPI0028A9259F|nr:hypothetical protein [Proteiniphilum saccharofermentans]
MRAKEFLAHRKDIIHYYSHVKKAIRDLYPLRGDRSRTEAYFNRYLFADARRRVDENFVLREDEVDHAIALEVRVEILRVIAEDDSFMFAYNIIAEGRNEFCDFDTMQLCEPREEDAYAVQEMKALYGNDKEEWQQAVEAIIHCLLEYLNLQLSEEQLAQKDELWILVREFYNNYCKPYIIKNETDELKEILARKEVEIAELKQLIDHLAGKLSRYLNATAKDGMTVAEITLTFYYLFDALGVNFSNSDKTQWARFIHTLSGKSFHRIRESLSFDFDNKNTQKNLRNVATLFAELFPQIKNKIENDMKPLL